MSIYYLPVKRTKKKRRKSSSKRRKSGSKVTRSRKMRNTKRTRSAVDPIKATASKYGLRPTSITLSA